MALGAENVFRIATADKIILTLFAERSTELQKSKYTFQKMVIEQEPCTLEILQRVTVPCRVMTSEGVAPTVGRLAGVGYALTEMPLPSIYSQLLTHTQRENGWNFVTYPRVLFYGTTEGRNTPSSYTTGSSGYLGKGTSTPILKRSSQIDQRNQLRDLRGRVESIRELDEGAELIDIEYARVLNGLRRGVLNELHAKIVRLKGELGTLVNHLHTQSAELNRCVKELAASNALTQRRYLLTSEASKILEHNVQQLRRLVKMSRPIQSQYKVPTPGQLIDVYRENKLLTKALPVAQKRLVMNRELFKKHKKIWAEISGSKR
ncbi:hypothetical protein X801_09037 [Opisthorchis viverrini]|uniref:Uncharacterized protein n=1 Tax=Opisthorchis viverrini TaxID=6198 RepID=A0A1S8WL39_OPIVI|nr:hypothetical protein X801_09037 [Opisthorchis viverrini]